MSFQLKTDESMSQGVKRVVRSEIEDALEQLRANDQNEEETVHETRKTFKKVRAALRLVRDELGDTVYRRENFLFRDAARPLTEVRDAKILIEALDHLTEHFSTEIEAGKFAKVREALVAKQQTVTQRVLKEHRAFATVADEVAPAIDRIPDWTIGHMGWSAVGRGLKRTYRAGHRALAAAEKESSMENLHEWRKQAKYLWHQLQLLESAWISREEDLGDEVHTLTQILGDDHDLAVLRWLVFSDSITYGGEDVAQSLIAFIDRRRADLQRQAFVCGQHIYRDSPKDFTKRIKRGWDDLGSKSADSVTIAAWPARSSFMRRARRSRRSSRSPNAAGVRIFAWPARSSLASRIKGSWLMSHSPNADQVRIFAWPARAPVVISGNRS